MLSTSAELGATKDWLLAKRGAWREKAGREATAKSLEAAVLFNGDIVWICVTGKSLSERLNGMRIVHRSANSRGIRSAAGGLAGRLADWEPSQQRHVKAHSSQHRRVTCRNHGLYAHSPQGAPASSNAADLV